MASDIIKNTILDLMANNYITTGLTTSEILKKVELTFEFYKKLEERE